MALPVGRIYVSGLNLQPCLSLSSAAALSCIAFLSSSNSCFKVKPKGLSASVRQFTICRCLLSRSLPSSSSCAVHPISVKRLARLEGRIQALPGNGGSFGFVSVASKEGSLAAESVRTLRQKTDKKKKRTVPMSDDVKSGLEARSMRQIEKHSVVVVEDVSQQSLSDSGQKSSHLEAERLVLDGVSSSLTKVVEVCCDAIPPVKAGELSLCATSSLSKRKTVSRKKKQGVSDSKVELEVSTDAITVVKAGHLQDDASPLTKRKSVPQKKKHTLDDLGVDKFSSSDMKPFTASRDLPYKKPVTSSIDTMEMVAESCATLQKNMNVESSNAALDDATSLPMKKVASHSKEIKDFESLKVEADDSFISSRKPLTGKGQKKAMDKKVVEACANTKATKGAVSPNNLASLIKKPASGEMNLAVDTLEENESLRVGSDESLSLLKGPATARMKRWLVGQKATTVPVSILEVVGGSSTTSQKKKPRKKSKIAASEVSVAESVSVLQSDSSYIVEAPSILLKKQSGSQGKMEEIPKSRAHRGSLPLRPVGSIAFDSSANRFEQEVEVVPRISEGSCVANVGLNDDAMNMSVAGLCETNIIREDEKTRPFITVPSFTSEENSKTNIPILGKVTNKREAALTIEKERASVAQISKNGAALTYAMEVSSKGVKMTEYNVDQSTCKKVCSVQNTVHKASSYDVPSTTSRCDINLKSGKDITEVLAIENLYKDVSMKDDAGRLTQKTVMGESSKVTEKVTSHQLIVGNLKRTDVLPAVDERHAAELIQKPSDFQHTVQSSHSQLTRFKDVQQMIGTSRSHFTNTKIFDGGPTGQHTGPAHTEYNRVKAYGLNVKEAKKFSVRNVVANQASTSCYLQIYGTGFDVGDTIPTVLLFFDRRRFIFNVGEGLQRFCIEHKFKLSKIDHVFLTRVCSETAGGLPGLLLTLSGNTGSTVHTWGPSNLESLVGALRLFVPSDWVKYTHSFYSSEDKTSTHVTPTSCPIVLVNDELVKISAVFLLPSSRFEGTSMSAKLQQESDAISVVYICELSEVAGKFDPVKALEKGLKPGKKYGQLQRGESVLSDDGSTIVYPKDVLGESHPGPIVMIIDCPTPSYVHALVNSNILQAYFSGGTGKNVNCMVHLSPCMVTSSQDYKDWMEKFRDAQHLMTRSPPEELGMPVLKSSATLLAKLNLVCPRLFPTGWLNSCSNTKNIIDGPRKRAENLQKFHLRPLAKLGLDSSSVESGFDLPVVQAELLSEDPKISEARQKVEDILHEHFIDSENLPKCLQDVTREEMEVVFLGTGSSQPSKYRNVTGIYIHLFRQGGVLLDCGEGTYGQLRRRYGSEGCNDVLKGLKCIWISHIHADHHVGLTRLLSVRKWLSPDPILVVGPKTLKKYLDAYQIVEDLSLEFVDCSQTVQSSETYVGKDSLITSLSKDQFVLQYVWRQQGFHAFQGVDEEGRKRLQSVLHSLGLKNLFSIPVVHCPHAFGVVLEAEGRQHRPGWKLVYSGDTRPCKALAEASEGATILIHEATFDNDMLDEAIEKNHSMTNEAIQIGMAAGAYRIFLTHFSQRYPKIPLFDEVYGDRTSAAFDMMSVNLADLPLIPKLSQAFWMVFQDDDDVDEGEGDDNCDIVSH